jgi:arylsulfatase A-like enzyme
MTKNRRPNVLIFCVDQMRADHMAPSGNRVVQTPNLQQLADGGTLFSRSYCANPICMPARHSMFTGLLPRDHGVRINGHYPVRDLPYLPQLLSDSGYRTHASGKLHLTPWVPKEVPANPSRYPESLDHWSSGAIDEFPDDYFGFQSTDFVGGHTSYAYGDYTAWLTDRGGDPAMLTKEHADDPTGNVFETYAMGMPEELHYNRFIADSTIRSIQTAVQSESPFLEWCSFPDPHHPIAPPSRYSRMYDPASIPLPVKRDGEMDSMPAYYRELITGELEVWNSAVAHTPPDHTRQMIANTYGMITHVDVEMGRVLRALEGLGQRENTAVLFVCDHGDMMGDHGLHFKGTFTYRGCTEIPTIVNIPWIAGSGISEALVSQVDLLPSILELCGIEYPGSLWCNDDAPFPRGMKQDLSLGGSRSWLPLVRGDTANRRNAVVIENDDPYLGYHVRCLVTDRHRLTIYPGTGDGELFDLQEDPHELFNRWYDPAFSSTRRELTALLLDEYAAASPFAPIPAWNA